MKRNRTQLLTVLSLLITCLLAACTAAPTSTPQPTTSTEEPTQQIEGHPIILGDISDDPANIFDEMQPLADYLAARLADEGVTEGQVKVVSSPEEMIAALENGEIDLYFDSVYPATVIGDASKAQPILRRWKDGVEKYHTVIYTTKESDITSVEDLQGHMIAFDEPTSTSGYVLPFVYLVEQGLKPVEKSTPEDKVAPDEVGYVFSSDDDNSLEWLNGGLVSAAATDNITYKKDIPAEMAPNLVVLAETESLPRQIAIARPGLDPDLQAAIIEVLKGADETPEGQAALEAFDDTARFDEFPEGIDQAIKRMRELLEIVRKQQQ